MKKLMAGAFAASLSGVVLAQSTVTIYGLVDMSVSRINKGQSNLTFLPVALIGQSGTTTLRPATSSRLGFRGTEDLGGGLRANFLLENRFSPDNGDMEPGRGPGFFNAATWVGLSGGFGEVRLGRQYVPAFYVGLASDPWSYDYNVAGGAGFTRGGNPITTALNAVTYTSPKFGGFTTHLLYGLGEGASSALNAPAGRVGANFGANVQYADGPLWAGLGYNDARQKDTAVVNRYWNFGVAYDFGFIRPIASVSQGKNNLPSNAASKAYLVGATMPLGGGRLKAVVGRYDPAIGINPNVANSIAPPPGVLAGSLPTYTAGQSTLKVGLGYEYFLSKRSSVHADIGSAKTQAFTRTTGVEVGVKHVF